MHRSIVIVAAVIASTATAARPAHAAIVYSNAGSAPGDSFTNPFTLFTAGQAVGTSGWFYNNVRGGGVVGINTAYPRLGDGSVLFISPSGSGKADIEFLGGAVTNIFGNATATSSLGSFAAFQGMSYDWYRDGTSTNPAAQHPALRILIDADGNLATTGDRGYLIFERSYNALPTLTDQWVSDTIGPNTVLWNSSTSGLFGPQVFNRTLAQWQAQLPNAVILGFSSGVGSGWNGQFRGAVDNISWTIAGQTTTTNFEVAAPEIPEPATLGVLAALGLTGLVCRRRRAWMCFTPSAS
ncbi:MAG: PEP-CTERM sorting domain-containing protein [Gemmataceae bacterium]|nr:PEP-CTERM sorting domain-containing protein [Gemmata sp.]MDW8197888.1 PEP-CTERM sorting domain-containing protein [Gemmataceae bacterium]